jgi:hypothetical protein
VSFYSSHLAIKIATMFILWKIKKLQQKSIFPQKIQKSLCITAKSMNNFKYNYLENYNDSNKKCSIFHELSEYQQKGQLFFLLGWSFKHHVFFTNFIFLRCCSFFALSCTSHWNIHGETTFHFGHKCSDFSCLLVRWFAFLAMRFIIFSAAEVNWA